MTVLTAPWTDAQVRQLNVWQRSDHTHPFTCAARSDGRHGELHGDKGTLVATQAGWLCPWCDYTQDWAHDFMANPEALLHMRLVLAQFHKRALKHPPVSVGDRVTIAIYGVPDRTFVAEVVERDADNNLRPANFRVRVIPRPGHKDDERWTQTTLHYDDFVIVEDSP